MYATCEDMCALIESLPPGDPKTQLQRLGREGGSLDSQTEGSQRARTDHYPGWEAGERAPPSFWFYRKYGPKGKTRPEVEELLRDTRIPNCETQYNILHSLCPKVNFRELQPTRDWGRGAGFPGHRAAIIREMKAYEAAAVLQRAEADRLTEKIQKLSEPDPTAKRKKTVPKNYYAAQLEALRKLKQKALSEADFFDRQALASKRFTSPEGASGDANSPHEPTPADSLDQALAASSSEESLSRPESPQRREPASAPSPSSSPVDVGKSGVRSRPSTSLDTNSLPPAASGGAATQRTFPAPPVALQPRKTTAKSSAKSSAKSISPPPPTSRRGRGNPSPPQQSPPRRKQQQPHPSKAKARPRGGTGRKT